MEKKYKFLTILTAVMLFLIPNVNSGQSPNLKTAAEFILFTTNGGLGNTGVSQIYGGAIGTNSGAITGFDNVNCVKHIQDAATAQCSLDLQAAFNEIHIIPVTRTIIAANLSDSTRTAGVYLINSAVNLTVDLTLDAQNHPNALFIFNVTGAFNAAAAIKIVLLNGALAQNVYWNVDAAVGFGAGASMKGTFLSSAGAITIGAGSSLEGRALTISGAVTIDNDILVKCLLPVVPVTTLIQPTCSVSTGTITVTAPIGAGLTYSIDGSDFNNTTGIFSKVPGGIYTVTAKDPGGCMSWKNETIKSFGHAPDLRTVSDFILFTSAGAVGNTGISTITGGAIGTNFGAITGFNDVDCVKHTQDAATVQCALDLQAVFNEIHNIPITQTLVTAPSGGTFTAGVYLISSAVSLTADLTLDAQNNPNALFIFNVTGAFNAAAAIKIILLNGALAQNIYWNVDAAVDFGAGTHMKGIFLSLAGAINLADGASLEGRALTIAGAVNIYNSPVTVCIRPAAPTVTLTQPSAPGATGTINITGPIGTGMKYRIDYCTYTNTTGTFTLVPPGTYPVTAKNPDGCISSITNVTINTVPITWIGSISTDWNNMGNWSGSVVPDNTSNVIIPDASTTSHDPVLPSVPAATAKTITIQSGGIFEGGTATTLTVAGGTDAWQNRGAFNSGTSTVIFTNANATITYPANFYNVTINFAAGLTINAGAALTVSGSLKNNSGTSGLIIKSGASGDGKLLYNSPVQGTVELYLIGSHYHFIVPPVKAMTLYTNIGTAVAEARTSFGNSSFNGDLLSYNESLPSAITAKDLGWSYFNGFGTNPPFQNSPFSVLISSQGYNYYVTPGTITSFHGIINAQAHTFNLSKAGLGWNLVGNPYPCNYNLLDVTELTTDKNGVDKTVYINKDGGYVYYNVSTQVGIGWSSGIFPPMQGFFVHVTETGKSLTLPVGSKTLLTFPSRAKSSTTTNINSIPLLKLVLSNSTGSDETVVCLIDKATNKFDGDFDAYKLFGTSTTGPNVYTELGSVKYAIDCVPGPVSEPVIIPLNVELKSQGTYKIDITQFDNLDGTNVVLKHGAIETSLSKDASYSFTSEAGTFTDFELIFGSTVTGVENPLPENERLKTWYSNNHMYINCPADITTGNGTLTIYDTQGKPVYQNIQLYMTPGQTIQLQVNLPDGMYVTRVLNNNQAFVSKIVVF